MTIRSKTFRECEHAWTRGEGRGFCAAQSMRISGYRQQADSMPHSVALRMGAPEKVQRSSRMDPLQVNHVSLRVVTLMFNSLRPKPLTLALLGVAPSRSVCLFSKVSNVPAGNSQHRRGDGCRMTTRACLSHSTRIHPSSNGFLEEESSHQLVSAFHH